MVITIARGRLLKRIVILAGYFVVVSAFLGHLSSASAWFFPGIGFSVPHLVRFTGTLYHPGEKKETVGDTFKVFVNQTEWTFKVNKARDLSGDMTELGLLKHIFPPIMTLRGPDSLIGALQKPEIAGKPLTIKGYLYAGDRILQVTSVEKIDATKGS